jgi:hypothetical protein
MPLSNHAASTSSPPPVPRMLESVSALLVSELGAEVIAAVLQEGSRQPVDVTGSVVCMGHESTDNLTHLFVGAAGFGGTDCSQCGAGTYSTGGFLNACVACGPGQLSPPGSPSADFCACPAGQGAAAAGSTTCSACPPNTYSLGPLTSTAADKQQSPARASGLSVCPNCPDGRISPAGSTSPDDCGEWLCLPLLHLAVTQSFLSSDAIRYWCNSRPEISSATCILTE